MKFIITIDTEADNQWQRNKTVAVENLSYIPRFQALCDKYGFKPTYLCTYEIVEHNIFEQTLKLYQDESRAEIGAHLHPWTNPPYENEFDACNEIDRASYPSELPLELFKQKMTELGELIYQKTNRKPTSYRAGRWGFNGSHIDVLLGLGYIVDTSVTPFTSWAHHMGNRKGGEDYRDAKNHPYFLDQANVCLHGNSKLLEVPTTILSTSRLFDSTFLEKLLGGIHKTSVGKSIAKKLNLSPKWFRPYPEMSTNELIEIYNVVNRRKLPVLQMMFHSSELMPGGSPYFPTEESIEELYSTFETLFRYMSDHGAEGVTLSEFASEYISE